MAVYVKVPGIYKKFKQAETENRVLFISAPTGYGKSAAFHYYYRRKPSLILNGRTGRLDRMPKPESIRQSVIVFDAVCFINDEESKQYMINMIKYGQKSVILMGRGTLPGWLVSLDMESEFIRADKSDLCFTAKEMVEYLKKNGMETTIEMAEMIIEKVQGFPLLAILYAKNLNGKVEYSEDVYGKAVRELYQIFDEVVWNVWDDTLIKVLLAICEFEHYTVELMEKVTGISKLGHMIEYAYSIGNFVTYLGGRVYRLDERLREYMKWKRTFIYSQEEFLNLYRNAAEYYEENEEMELALKYYSKAGKYDKMADILIRNAEYDAARVNLFKTRSYIFSLSEEIIRNSPALLGSISLVYSIMMCPEESEKWYGVLKDFEQDENRSEEERKDAKMRLAYLDISLLHRTTEERIEGVFRVSELIKKEKIHIPELTITGNSPSVANGGLDFSYLLNTDKKFDMGLEFHMQQIMGKIGKTIATLAITEGLFEKNNIDAYEVMKKANEGYMIADAAGRMELCFVAIVLLVRQHVVRGQIGVAIEQINSFKQKAQQAKAYYLFSNIEAIQVWLHLLKGDTQRAKEWLKRAPDENIEFYITDRYLYIQKIRVFMALGKLEQAYALIQRLNVYFEQYHREYFWIQNQLFHAVIVYRTGGTHWEEILLKALERAEKYHFVRFVADGGSALLPLLKKLKRKKQISDVYLAEIMDETEKIVKLYPDYLKAEIKLNEQLTKKEMEILRLMHYGKRTEEICDICEISYSGLKFHNRNIYRKLGVSSRQEAERKAVLLRIVD